MPALKWAAERQPHLNMEGRHVAGPGGLEPSEPLWVTFPNRVNVATFFREGLGTGLAHINNAKNNVCVTCLPHRCGHVQWCRRKQVFWADNIFQFAVLRPPSPPPPRGGPLRLKTQLRGRRSGILAPHKPRWELYTRCGHERFETNYLQARPFIRAVRHTSVVGWKLNYGTC